MGVDSPIVGSGPNTFTIEGTLFRLENEVAATGNDSVDDPHSVLMSFFANAGGLGVLGLLIVAAWIVGMVVTNKERLLAWGFLGALSAYASQALVSIDEITLRATFWVLLGGLAASCAGSQETEMWKFGPSAPFRKRAAIATATISVILILIVAWWAGRFVLADAHVREAASSLAASDVEEAREAFESAISLRNEAHYRRLYGLSLGRIAAKGPEEAAEALLPEVLHQYGYLDDIPEPRVAIEYADLLRQIGAVLPQALEESVTAYELAVMADPLNPSIREAFSSVLTELGREEEAAEILKIPPP